MPELDAVLTLENEFLRFQLFADASGTCLDRASGQQWKMGRIAFQETGQIVEHHVYHRPTRVFGEEYPGRFKVQREGERILFTLYGRLGVEKGRFACKIRLDGPWLEFDVHEIDEALPSLIFPPPFECESMVLPLSIGKWIRQPIHDRLFYTAFGDLSMRWFGGLRGDHGWMGIFTRGHFDAGIHVMGLGASPGWLKSMGRWSGERAVRYRFTSGGYVGQARTFRAWAQENGIHRSLKEKLAQTPQLQNLIGGRILSFHQAKPEHIECYEEAATPIPDDVATNPQMKVMFTHADAKRIASEARSLGMSKGVLNVRGWIAGGYDDSHPDIWPPEPKLGTQAELRQLLSAEGFTGVLHDNYQDIYEGRPSFPAPTIRQKDGQPMFGGLWWGGQSYLICSHEAVAYAKRNWEQIRQLQPGGMFIDTTTAAALYECHSSDHPISRSQDEHYKLELLRFLKAQGQMLGSEEARDFGVPVLDFLENRHHHEPGVTVPLWPLVFHDAIVCARYQHPTDQARRGSPALNMLTDMLWGYAVHWGARGIAYWNKCHADFRKSLAVDAWHARIGLDDLRDHRFLTEDRLVEQTEFSSGLALIANFSSEPRTVEGVTIGPGEHLARD